MDEVLATGKSPPQALDTASKRRPRTPGLRHRMKRRQQAVAGERAGICARRTPSPADAIEPFAAVGFRNAARLGGVTGTRTGHSKPAPSSRRWLIISSLIREL
jgi:hypothetical protein